MDDYGFPGPAAPVGSSAYYVLRFAAPREQAALVALFAWRRELIRIATGVSDAGLARIKLHWWREELERAAAGMAQHPLAGRLAAAAAAHALPLDRLDAMAEATDADLRGETPATLDALQAHCDLAGGAFGELLARVGGADPGTGQRLGAAARLAEILRDLGADLRRNRCRLPHAELAQAGLSPERLRHADSRPGLATLLGRVAADARVAGRHTGPAGRWHALRRALLDEVAADPLAVLDAHVALTPLRKLWIAWRG
jgi:phytoene synthase